MYDKYVWPMWCSERRKGTVFHNLRVKKLQNMRARGVKIRRHFCLGEDGFQNVF